MKLGLVHSRFPACYHNFLNCLDGPKYVDSQYNLNLALIKYRGIYLREYECDGTPHGSYNFTDYIEFETEEDAIIFKLLFS